MFKTHTRTWSQFVTAVEKRLKGDVGFFDTQLAPDKKNAALPDVEAIWLRIRPQEDSLGIWCLDLVTGKNPKPLVTIRFLAKSAIPSSMSMITELLLDPAVEK